MAEGDKKKKSVLFICLGNICRSPIAEAVFLHLIRSKGLEDDWDVDSAALGSWHCGGSPDHRAMKTLKSHDISYRHTVRQIIQEDFHNYDFIFGMDKNNMKELASLQPKNSKAKCLLLGSYDPEGELIIKDPYYDSNDKGFEKCYEQCMRSCQAFLEKEG